MSDGTPLYAPAYPPGAHTKGGGLRGGPKRWTGAGPRPARHIPWPEIFKHHISVVEGHLKMLDMIRKHTVPNTGNWRSICTMVDRAHDMLRMAKDATRSFVPPSNEKEQVPIGSSSASMYPGYSPADHQYGEAAQEFGAAWSAAKSNGLEFKPPPDGPQYEMAQAKGVKKSTLAGIRAAKAARGEGSGSGSGSGSEAPTARSTSNGVSTNGNKEDAKSEDATKENGNPYFVVDTNPTPVNLPGISHQPAKRTSDEQSPKETGHRKSKKAKTKHEGEPVAIKEKRVEFEDISAEVDARLKEKEEKRKRKEEKKRKRVSDEAPDAAAETVAEAVEVATEVEKPKKKKSKKAGENGVVAGAEGIVPAKRSGSSGDEAAGESGKTKKKPKRSKEGKQGNGNLEE
ncbi:MAG: hypothetical protein Q9187_002595 [Circinaria calcarea]